jgi:hypothetical protein
MINWYDKNDLKISFDVVPDPKEQFIIPGMTNDEVKAIYKKPYILENQVSCEIVYKNQKYSFIIPQGYTWDGATIPQVVWSLIGADTDNHFLIASLIHDTLCENHQYINNNRHLSTMVFCALLEVAKVSTEKRDIMSGIVDNYQKLKGKWGK